MHAVYTAAEVLSKLAVHTVITAVLRTRAQAAQAQRRDLPHLGGRDMTGRRDVVVEYGV
jgi:hypothetical protein